jgi:hypothetical protein
VSIALTRSKTQHHEALSHPTKVSISSKKEWTWVDKEPDDAAENEETALITRPQKAKSSFSHQTGMKVLSYDGE